MSTKNYSVVFHSILGLFSLVICLLPNLTPLCIILFILCVGYGFGTKKLAFKFNWFFAAIVLLYMLYLVGIFYSKDVNLGLRYAEYKLSFLIIPLVFSFKSNFKISFKMPAIGLALGTVIAGVIGFYNAFNCYETYPYVIPCFTSSNISPIHHPSYFSIYLLIAIMTLWAAYKNDNRRFVRITIVLFTVYAFSMYLLCLSMAGLLFLMVLGAVALFLWLRKKMNTLIAGLLVVIMPVTFIFVATKTPGLAEDIDATKASFNEYLFDQSTFLERMSTAPEINGNETRLIMWMVTLDLIKRHPMGAGTGSLDILLANELNRHKLYDFASKSYNPHNQFLQTTLEIGILGFILLSLIYYFGFKIALNYRSKILFVLLFSFLFNSLFESMFQRQSGIYFFTFWGCLMVTYLVNSTVNVNQNKNSEDRLSPLNSVE